MAEDGLREISHNTFVLSRPDGSREVPYRTTDPLVEALYLYIPVPFQATHVLTVNICVVPFCIPSYRGQLFYHVEAFYAQCCEDLGKTDFMPTIVCTVQRIYSICMSHHTWNFDVADAWFVVPVHVFIFHPTLITSHRRQVQVPEAVLQQSLTCPDRSILILNHLAGAPRVGSGVGEFPRPIHSRAGSNFYYEQQRSRDEISKLTSGSISSQQIIQHPAKDKRIQDNQEPQIINFAERFLAGFPNANLSGVALELHDLHQSNTEIQENRDSEPVVQAFQYCRLVAVQANEQSKHATFTRFISLCFFLIWEALAYESGKAGARAVRTLKESQTICFTIDCSSDQCKDEGGRFRRDFEKPQNTPRRNGVYQPACGFCRSQVWNRGCFVNPLQHLRYGPRLKQTQTMT